MKIITLGAPGSGKGTQAEIIAQKLSIVKVSTGDILRDEIRQASQLGLQVKDIMASGGLVSDDLIIQIVKKRINQQDCQNGFILDGFPRTLAQAHSLTYAKIKFNYIIEITISNELIIKRITGRRIHKSSGRTYNIEFNPPKKPGFDDITGEPLIQREDDTKQVVMQRLREYDKKTAPLINYYKDISDLNDNCQYLTIDGSQDLEQVSLSIMQKINQKYIH